jgi:hypothetical protein
LDVYSFGVVLLEIATGLRAYDVDRQSRSLVSFCAERRKASAGDETSQLAERRKSCETGAAMAP